MPDRVYLTLEDGYLAALNLKGILRGLSRAQAEHRLDRQMRVYLAPKVLIIDEFGVWPYDRMAATALFTLISARYERGSVILNRRGSQALINSHQRGRPGSGSARMRPGSDPGQGHLTEVGEVIKTSCMM